MENVTIDSGSYKVTLTKGTAICDQRTLQGYLDQGKGCF